METTFVTGRQFRRGKKDVRRKQVRKTRANYDQEHTPNEIVANKLAKVLENYSDIKKDTRFRWRDEMSKMEQLRYMNMEALAVALIFLNNMEGDLTPENFTDENISILVGGLLPKKEEIEKQKLTDEDIEVIYIKTKATLFRYIRAVLFFRGMNATE